MLAPVRSLVVVALVVSGCHGAAPPRPSGETLVGEWRGSSLCLVKPSACHDETVVYHLTAALDPDRFTLLANKLVDGKEEEMGTLTCQLDRSRHVLSCPFERGTFVYAIDGERMHGRLDLPDGTQFRTIEVTRQP